MKVLLKAAVLGIFAFLLSAQDITTAKYIAYKETSLSTAAEVITVQQPSTGARNAYFYDASVYCSVDCTATIEKDGTAATSTALTVVALQDSAPTASVKAYYSSNVGTGTVVNKLSISAGNTLALDLAGMGLSTNNTARNFTIRTNSISGTVRVTVRWIEK